MTDPRLAVIAIGRNEGNRLRACLASLQATGQFAQIVYVDSGSTDESIVLAEAAGASIVHLDTSVPFTAARARNAGIARLTEGNVPDLVQFIDGDCTIDSDWIAQAVAFLTGRPEIAVVCGRRREMFPQASVYNRLCDAEWDTPVGAAGACGGDALMRWVALCEVEGYNPVLIAGEEPEMCLRMCRAGWGIWRLDAEMTLHDANITRFGQFWARMKRGGFAYAEGAALYGRGPEQHNVAGLRKALIWGLVLPVLIGLSVLIFGAAAALLVLIYPAQIIRLASKRGGDRSAWERATLLTVGKFAEAHGAVGYLWRRLRRGPAQLIEYK